MTVYLRTASLTTYAELARSLGLNPLQMLEQVALPPECLHNANLRVPATAVMTLLERSAQQSGEPAFGLRLAETRRLSTLGLLGLLVRDEPTLREALATLKRFGNLHNEAVSVVVEDRSADANDSVLLRFDFVPVPGVGPQAAELAVGAIHRILHIVLGPQWQARAVLFSHAAPARVTEHQRFFGTQVRFGQEVTGIVLARRDLDSANAMADPVMRDYAKQLLDEAKAFTRAQTRIEVQQLILALMPTGYCNASQVATYLGVDRRTVHRRLAEEGCNFSDLLQQTRMDLATRRLAQGNLPLTEIAQLLGFRSLSAFSRWKREHRLPLPEGRSRS